jgi:DNA helicase HerA-like ATPase
MAKPFLLAKSEIEIFMLPQLSNRHGLVAGATGTGKTVTLRVMAEHFSELGVPVFMADVKGDLASMADAGQDPKMTDRAKKLGVADFGFKEYPVTFWDVFGEQGHNVRATVSEMGPLLLSRMLNLNDTQEGVLALAFKVADDQGLLLLDMKDLRAMLQFVGDHAADLRTEYGNVSAASIGTIQRGLLALEQQGGAALFGEPALDLNDLLQNDTDGRGMINILAADKLMQNPKTYATLLLWLLSELYETLPEIGNPDKPKLVFFFDEAHLLFDEAPKVLLEKIEQVVRLVRSKGVGVYFVTQNPLDVPDVVLGQLGNRVQHALRAFTPRDQKAVRAAAETFRPNPKVNVETAIGELAVGEALVSLLDEKGTPEPVERAAIIPPQSRLGATDATHRQEIIKNSVLYGHYEKAVDRESAYETLKARAGQALQSAAPTSQQTSAPQTPQQPPAQSGSGWLGQLGQTIFTGTGRRESLAEAMAKSAARAVGSSVGRQVIRGVLGSILGGSTSRKRY